MAVAAEQSDARSTRPSSRAQGLKPGPWLRPLAWMVAVAFCLGGAACVGLFFYARPSYDAMGWMVWGRQILHWNLNTYGQPAWKPLPLIVTLPAALTGHRLQLWLWTLTACGAGVGAPLMAGRLAYRLSPRDGRRVGRLAPWLAAVIAAVTVASMADYFKVVLQANSDPLVVLLLLAALDRVLSRRYGWALSLFWLAALGLPQAWPFLGLYAMFLLIRVPGLRLWAVLALVLIPAAWFIVPGLTSSSWFSPGTQALQSVSAIHGDKLIAVPNRLRTLTGSAMQWEILGSLLLVLLRRNRGAMLLAGAGIMWTAVEIGLALHGWSASQRFLMEGGACLAVVGGVGAAHAVTWRPWRAWRVLDLRWAGAVAVLAVIALSISFLSATTKTDRVLVASHRIDVVRLDRLSQLVAMDGGARAIRSCGQPNSGIGTQSILAWELDMNTGNVGFRPRRTLRRGKPMMWFRWVRYGWTVDPVHVAAAKRARCRRLHRTTSTMI